MENPPRVSPKQGARPVPSNRHLNHHSLQKSPMTRELSQKTTPCVPAYGHGTIQDMYIIYFRRLPRHLTPGLSFHSLHHNVLQLLAIVRLSPTPTTIPRDELKARVNKKQWSR